MRRVTGVGGMFFKSDNPKKIARWYGRRLGIHIVEGDAGIFEWKTKNGFGHTV